MKCFGYTFVYNVQVGIVCTVHKYPTVLALGEYK